MTNTADDSQGETSNQGELNVLNNSQRGSFVGQMSQITEFKLEEEDFSNVKVKNCCKKLKLYVIENGGPPIIGRDWLGEFDIFSSKLGNNSLACDDISKLFPSVFKDTLGCYKLKEFELYLKEDVVPIFCEPRVLPFALKDKVSEELDRLVKEDILVAVETSEWGTPIVPVIKAVWSIRLCDLSQAYQQLPLSMNSQKLTTISTHKGLFMYKRLPYRVTSAPGILQREMESMLSGCEGVGCFFDDIVISGIDKPEVNERLHKVLRKLDSAGLTVRKEKCEYYKTKITFLGYSIDEKGLHIPTDRIKAISEVPTPNNIHELKAFLGLVNYYGKFVPNMSTVASPLYALLRNNIKFIWGKEQKKGFDEIKKILLSNKVLIHYNTDLELILACDASPVGLGAVLSHRLPDGKDKPIAFTSRTLTKSEQGYSQIDKEALALVYGVKYFHQFLYGRKFILRTDHKLLISIFGEGKGIPTMASHRLQRYAIFLSGYSFTIQFIKGSDNGNADALSRLPLIKSDKINFEESVSDLDICKEVKRDLALKEVFLKVFTGNWPDNIKNISDELKPYYYRKNELAIEQGCLMWGHRLIIPTKFRKELLQELHSTHLGIVKMKNLARSYVWWPKIDNDIEKIIKECEKCLAYSDNPPRSVLRSWPWPEGPAQRVHLDFMGPVNGNMFVCVIDAYSKWVFIKYMKNITTFSTVKVLKEYFSLWGIPAKLVTDNGPSLCSEDFELFLKNNGVFHIKTSPYNPSSNGAAENLVRIFKNYLKKCSQNSDLETNIYKFNLSYNSSKHGATGVSPAELHLGRSLFTSLDRLLPFAKSKYDKNLENAARNNRGGREKKFDINDKVMCKNYGKGEKWLPGVILKILSPVTYLVSVNGFCVWKRHINQIIGRMESQDRVLVVPLQEKGISDIGISEVVGEKVEDLQKREGELIDEEISLGKELLEPTRFKSIISSGFSDNVQSKGKLLVKSHHVINVKEILLGNNSQINGHVIRQASVTLHPYLVKLVVNGSNRDVVEAVCQCPAGIGGKCKHVYALTHYINTESGHSKTSDRCEWNEPKISKAGKEKYCKGKRIEELFPPKSDKLTQCTHTNTISNFITPSLFKIVYDEEKKSEYSAERITNA
ncbi:uncharacterized protein K02A2.6-like [Metopolophium dirhodum]|uniref:uncharacterized protein K02A2.6-like n=1 Tax=Metopolophium dirhodum TaxID=44670 RepID=UPI00298F6319|nr:uncharacterized protein K02A2.6-like [Metopolophium dirhodum]